MAIQHGLGIRAREIPIRVTMIVRAGPGITTVPKDSAFDKPFLAVRHPVAVVGKQCEAFGSQTLTECLFVACGLGRMKGYRQEPVAGCDPRVRLPHGNHLQVCYPFDQLPGN